MLRALLLWTLLPQGGFAPALPQRVVTADNATDRWADWYASVCAGKLQRRGGAAAQRWAS